MVELERYLKVRERAGFAPFPTPMTDADTWHKRMQEDITAISRQVTRAKFIMLLRTRAYALRDLFRFAAIIIYAEGLPTGDVNLREPFGSDTSTAMPLYLPVSPPYAALCDMLLRRVAFEIFQREIHGTVQHPEDVMANLADALRTMLMASLKDVPDRDYIASRYLAACFTKEGEMSEYGIELMRDLDRATNES